MTAKMHALSASMLWCYITTAEHHVLGRGGLCRAACAWEGELWMFVSGGGVASVQSMSSRTDVLIFWKLPQH